jgi:hypothetical protein
MKSFYLWLETINNIFIDLSKYKKEIKDAISDLEDYSYQKAQELNSFKFKPEIIMKLKGTYPNYLQLIQALQSGNHKPIDDFVQWVISNKAYNPEMREIYHHVLDQDSKIRGIGGHNPEDYRKLNKDLLIKTNANMEKIQANIQKATASIPNWNNSPITIIAEPHGSDSSDVALEPGEDATIRLGTNADFSLFMNENQMIIDDVLEGGEEDEYFFGTNEIKADYFNLINELRNPGSSQKSNILTLYTARPASDRSFYQNTRYLPINIFLTNSFSHAEGLAHDLSSGEPRDIWKVKMDSRYLTQTLDGITKYYQVTTDKAPIISIKLA